MPERSLQRRRHVAIDVGASSGRVIDVTFDGVGAQTWLSSLENKTLKGCGKFTLVGDMPTDTVKVNLSNMDSLEGSLHYFANCKAITSFNVHGCKNLAGNCSYCLELEPRVGPDQ